MTDLIHELSSGGFLAIASTLLCICQLMMLCATIRFARLFEDLRKTVKVSDSSLPDEAPARLSRLQQVKNVKYFARID